MNVTVGIPTFNRATRLRSTVESVLAQTFGSFRLIVSDNASDDDTPEVVRSFDDKRIDYVRSERNIGSIGNLNRLISLAETEYLVLLPDDDELYPGHLAAMMQLLQRFENVGLAHAAFDLVDERSQVLERMDSLASSSPVTIESSDRALDRLMVSPWPICFSSVMYRTRAIVNAGGFREVEQPWCDLQLWMRIATEWDLGYLATPLVRIHLHPEAISVHVGAERGVTSDTQEAARLAAQFRFERRIAFLSDAPLDRRRTQRLRELAELGLLLEHAHAGLRWTTVTARLANLVRTHPRLLFRPLLWQFVAGKLGRGKVRPALRRASVWYRNRRPG